MKNHIMKFNDFINENKVVDEILDKINDIGFDKLSEYEKEVLSRASKNDFEHDSRDQDALKYLNDTYSNLNMERIERKKFNVIDIVETIYTDENLNIVISLETKVGSNKSSSYITNDVWDRLHKYYGLSGDDASNVLKTWLRDCYKIYNTEPSIMF